MVQNFAEQHQGLDNSGCKTEDLNNIYKIKLKKN